MVNSLLTAIVRADGDGLVMHVGERPYVVASSGPVELSSRPLTLEAVTGMLGQLLPFDARRALEELGAIEHELPPSSAGQGDRFSVVAARGGDDIWVEVRRHRKVRPVAPPQPVQAPAAVVRPVAVAAPAAVVAAPPAAFAPTVVAAPSPLVAAPVPFPAAAAIPRVEPARAVVAAPEETRSVEVLPAPPPPPVFAPVAAAEQPRRPIEPVIARVEAAPAVLVPPPAAFREPAPVATVAAPAGQPAPASPPIPVETAPTVLVPAEPAETRPALNAEPTPTEVERVAAAFEALVQASVPEPAPAAETPKAEEPLFRPLAAAPIVERPPLESLAFEPAPEPTRRAEPALSRPAAFVSPEPAPAVVLPLARSTSRVEPRSAARPAAGSIDRLLRLAAARGATTLYLIAQARPYVRVDGEIAVLDDEPASSAADVESLLLDLAPERNRQAIQAGECIEWMADVPEVGWVRCESFREYRGPGAVFQMLAARPVTAEQLGLSREIQALCAEPEGLVLVAGPRASGKSTLVSSLVDLVNRTRNDYVITIEGQIKALHETRGCLVSQREVRGGNDEWAAAVRGALRENPDVIVVEDMRSPEVVRLALDAMETGRLVIGGVSAHGAATAVGRIVEQAPEERRPRTRLALAEGLRGVVSQVLVRKSAGGRVAAREVLLNVPPVANLIAEGRIADLPAAIDGGRKQGMVPLNDALAAFVQSGVVDVREAYRKAFERPAFLAVLRREGVDTSFVERLA